MSEPTSYDIEMNLVSTGAELQNLRGLFGEAFTVASLGPTQTCRHCGFKLRAGANQCAHCSSKHTQTIPNSHYDKVARCFLSSLNISAVYSGLQMISLNLKVLGGLNYTEAFPFGMWQTTYLEDGWLCRYCNSVNANHADTCVGCGAGELPYSDIAKIRTHCLYCGIELRGETVCKGCASAGQGYSAWLPSVERLN